ncbi:MAG: FHA domain-containing protein, partial [Propionibacteriaceae bacterium]|nr:FHA domain-containing protein [Propionibacteriaceae bacterium]
YAAERGYIFNGELAINYIEDGKLPIGRFTVKSHAVASVRADDGFFAQAAPPDALAIEINQTRHPLVAPGLTIGRGNDVDLQINDPGISRQHARISVDDDGRVMIEDLGSTNGISVDGRKVQAAPLALGSNLTIGNTHARIVSAAG